VHPEATKLESGRRSRDKNDSILISISLDGRDISAERRRSAGAACEQYCSDMQRIADHHISLWLALQSRSERHCGYSDFCPSPACAESASSAVRTCREIVQFGEALRMDRSRESFAAKGYVWCHT
jgi:hypothetical protein